MEGEIDKALNKDQSEQDLFQSAIGCTIDSAFEDMCQIKKIWHKEKGVQGFHLVQSFAPGEISPELAHLETQVKQSGLPREEFLRTLIMGAELRAKPCDHHADLLHKVAGLCNNANQLAKVANTYGEASQQSVEEMTAIARQVWKEVKENW